MAPARTYLRNHWYAAAMSSEVNGDTLLHRKICNENVVLYRLSNGDVRVFADYCPHRKLPLSMGTLKNDELECAYHGLRFNSEGRCSFIPAQDQIPSIGLNVRPYIALERYGLVHIWIGDEGRADPALLAHFSEKEDPAWVGVEGHSHIAANYLLVLDNLNDLSHLAYVHRSTFGGNGMNEVPIEVSFDGDNVHVERWMPNSGQSGFIKKGRRFPHDRLIDRRQTSDFMLPSVVSVSLYAGEIGEEPSLHHIVFNSITPETESSAHYFWSVYRSDSIGDEAVSDYYRDLTVAAFHEDKLTIEAQQRAIDEDAHGPPLQAVFADKAALGVRRVIARHLRAQLAAEGTQDLQPDGLIEAAE